MKSLLIDIGSTNIKSMYCEEGGAGTVHKTPFPAPRVNDGVRFEVDPQEIVQIVRSVIDAYNCEKVFISTQMHGYLLADKSGRLLTDYISWQDRRAESTGTIVKIRQESGTAMKGNLPRAGVESFRKTDPKLYGQIGEFYTLGSYVAYVLTGRNATHITDAAASGFYDIKSRTQEKVSFALPQAYYKVVPVGQYSKKTIYTALGDQQCSVLGAGGDEWHTVLNLGTAAQLCTVECGFVKGEFESRPYFGGRTLCTVTGLPGGKVLAEYAGNAEEFLLKEYSAALKKLPRRTSMIVTGGVLVYRRELIVRVLKETGEKFVLHEGADALEGLKLIAEELAHE